MSVLIYDSKSISRSNITDRDFCIGCFAVKKSNCAFSSIGEDHAHEQNTKIIDISDYNEAL